MATTVDTSTVTNATGPGNGRRLDRCSNGVLWVTFKNASTGSYEFWYSTNDGATWAQDPTTYGATNQTTGTCSLFIDVNDYLHIVYNLNGVLYYRRGTPNVARTAWTFSAATSVAGGINFTYACLVAFPVGTDTFVHIGSERVGNTTSCNYSQVKVTSAGVITVEVSTSMNGDYAPVVDFRHTGDGKTPHATPHVYRANINSAGTLLYARGAYSAGVWTFPANTILENGTVGLGSLSMVFDGTRVILSFPLVGGTPKLIERDEGNTTTTNRSIPAHTGSGMSDNAISWDAAQNIYNYRTPAGGGVTQWAKYDRAAGTWSTGTVSGVAATAQPASLNVKRGYSDFILGQSIEMLVTEGASSPYNVRHYQAVVLNDPPNAPTWVTTAGPRDVAAALPLQWIHSDPDGDAQTAYRLSRTVSGVVRWWNGTDFSSTTAVDMATATNGVTLPAAWALAADATNQFTVYTADALTWSAASSALSIVPSAKVNPVVTAPVEGSTQPSPTSLTITHTATEQTEVRRRIYESVGGLVVYDSGWLVSGVKTVAVDYAPVNGTSYTAEVTTKNLEGLTSDPDTNTYTVVFVPPAVPTLTVLAQQSLGNIKVTPAQPTPSGGQPTVTHGYLYRRVVGDSSNGIRLKSDLGPTTFYLDWAVGSGVAYQYRLLAIGTTGAASYSAWTS